MEDGRPMSEDRRQMTDDSRQMEVGSASVPTVDQRAQRPTLLLKPEPLNPER
jgi:hypothetical protein